MYRDLHVTAVLPAFREAPHVGDVLRRLPPWLDRIVLVDDASDDGTAEAAEAVGDPRVEVVRLERNRGVGGAMARGYARALERGTDLVVKMDADGQMDPAHLEALLAPLAAGRADYAKGNRFHDLAALRAMPRRRLAGNLALSFLTKLASGYWDVFDPQNGFTAIRAEVLASLDLGDLDHGYFFENAMLCQLGVLGARVEDVPLPARYGPETSHLRIGQVLRLFPGLLLERFLARMYFQFVLREFSPIVVFGALGALLFGGGGLWGCWIWARTIWTGVPNPTGTIMLALVPLILGFQLLLQAVVMDIQRARERLRT